MQLAWLDGRLRQVCASEQQLRARFGPAAAAVKLLLTLLAHSDCLEDVRTHQSLRLSLMPPTTTYEALLLIRHKEIAMTAEPLDPAPVQQSQATTASWLDPVRGLRIVSISSYA